MAINSTRPTTFVAHTIFTVIAIFATVAVIPTRFTYLFTSSLILTVGETLVIAPNLWISPQVTFTALLSIFFAEIIAFASGWQLNYLSRREFLTNEEGQNSRVEAEMQLAERKRAEEALKKHMNFRRKG